MSMNKDQAIAAMHVGNKITHRLFAQGEYLHYVHGRLRDEHGYDMRCFFKYRPGDEWDRDWSIFDEQQKPEPMKNNNLPPVMISRNVLIAFLKWYDPDQDKIASHRGCIDDFVGDVHFATGNPPRGNLLVQYDRTGGGQKDEIHISINNMDQLEVIGASSRIAEYIKDELKRKHESRSADQSE